ncbi:DUF6279 family lipoprotein [Cupriavidus pinatubonensis]|uniref:DUF6279 family lipoprotein n=1 Tax=Cupriavidus pinatubonensis TaxID=248026 RepID=UPI0036076D0D
MRVSGNIFFKAPAGCSKPAFTAFDNPASASPAVVASGLSGDVEPLPGLGSRAISRPGKMRGDFNMTVSAQYAPVSDSHNRWLRLILAIFATAILCACSAMKTGYQHGDRLAYWWIDHYVDVSDAQEPLTRDAIARFFAWHRQAQLPEIAGLLTQARNQVQQPVSTAAIVQIQEASQRLARQSFDQAVPDVADLLLTLTPAQIDRMEKKFDEGNIKYRKKFLSGSAEDRESARFDKVMSYAKLIYGNFSNEQEQAIHAALAPLMQGAQARYAERLRRQEEWLALARRVQQTHPPKAQVVELLRRFGDHWQFPPGQVRATSYQANNQAGVTLAATIANLTTPTQKAHAAERFQKWIDDTRSLMRERQGNTSQAANK